MKQDVYTKSEWLNYQKEAFDRFDYDILSGRFVYKCGTLSLRRNNKPSKFILFCGYILILLSIFTAKNISLPLRIIVFILVHIIWALLIRSMYEEEYRKRKVCKRGTKYWGYVLETSHERDICDFKDNFVKSVFNDYFTLRFKSGDEWYDVKLEQISGVSFNVRDLIQFCYDVKRHKFYLSFDPTIRFRSFEQEVKGI